MDATLGELKPAEINNNLQNGIIDCSNYKVLIVEDDAPDLKVTKRFFQKYNFQIETCNSGNECVYRYKEGNHYDLILIDQKMPEMSGIEVMKIIRQLKDYKTPPLGAFTANAFSNSKDIYIKEGFDDYLAKPIDFIELNNLVNKYFKK